MPNFIPTVAEVRFGPQNRTFHAIFEYKRSTVAYPLGDCYEIFKVCGQLHVRLMTQISWIRSMGSGIIELKVKGAFPPTFSAPRDGKIVRLPLLLC